jgi:hypothetical protein
MPCTVTWLTLLLITDLAGCMLWILLLLQLLGPSSKYTDVLTTCLRVANRS